MNILRKLIIVTSIALATFLGETPERASAQMPMIPYPPAPTYTYAGAAQLRTTAQSAIANAPNLKVFDCIPQRNQIVADISWNTMAAAVIGSLFSTEAQCNEATILALACYTIWPVANGEMLKGDIDVLEASAHFADGDAELANQNYYLASIYYQYAILSAQSAVGHYRSAGNLFEQIWNKLGRLHVLSGM